MATKILEMVYLNAAGNEVTHQLLNPKDNLTLAQVNTHMNLCISKNLFTSTGGDLVGIVRADIDVSDKVALA